MADEITAAPSVSAAAAGPTSPTATSKDGSRTATGKPAGDDEKLDLSDDSPPANNNFAFTPGQLHKLSTTRSLAALRAFGGLPGLAAGLRSDLAAGLSVDETNLDGTVAFDEAIAAGNERRSPAITPLPGGAAAASSTTPPPNNGDKNAFKLDLAELAELGGHHHEPQRFADRRRVFGENRLPKRKQKSFLQLAWIAFNDKLMFLLTLSATISLALGIYETVSADPEDGPKIQWVDGVTVVVAILVIVIASATTDWQKNYKFAKLNERKEQRDVKVIRSGKTQNISVYDLLVGDVMHIETGDVVAVDGVLISGSGIQVDESSLSGESELVYKTAAPGEGAEGEEETTAVERKDGKKMVHRVSAADPFILSGTTVNGGVGNYLVISVGRNSTFGRTLMSLRNDVEETPLQQKLGKLAKQLITFGAIAGLIFFLILFIRFCVRLPTMGGTPSEKAMVFFKLLILAVTVVVVTVPEGLALAVTLALAFATTRMLRDKNLVRLIRSCEVMGGVSSICSDKTGTLTQNVMSIVAGHIGADHKFGDSAVPPPLPPSTDAKSSEGSSPQGTVVAPEDATETEKPITATAPLFENPKPLVASFRPEVRALLKDGIALNSTAFESDDAADGSGSGSGVAGFVGMSTETALLKFAREHLGMGPLAEERDNADIVDMFPFDASNKWMAVVVKLPGGRYRLYVKGAAEVVLERCNRTVSDLKGAATDDGAAAIGEGELASEPLSTETRDDLKTTVRSFAMRMLRPVAMAYRDLGTDPASVFADPSDPDSIEFKKLFAHLTFVSIFGIRDPLRPEVVDSVRQCQEAGVMVRMVTGDNFLTAKAIASECGIYTAGGVAMDGPTFRRLMPDQLDRVVPRLQVLARSSPEDKLLLVTHLRQRLGETVAVTGDGTNDALALKAADVGFAMGIQGTEVAKEAASIILLDDNFASIVRALSWGRTVNDAVRKFLQFQFTINITAGILTVVSELVGDAIFTVVQLLFINLIMDIFASLGLATDYPSPDFLKRRPQPRKAHLVSVTMWKMILGIAVYELAVIFTLHYAADVFFGAPTNKRESGQLQTLVFNVYVWMQFFNQHNCRRVDNKLNIWYQGVLRNPWFLGVQCATFAGQMVIIFKGGDAFDTVPLTGPMWGWSIFLGVMVIPLGALLRCVPDRYAAALFHAVGSAFHSVQGAFVRTFVPARFSKTKRQAQLERRRSRLSTGSRDGGGDDDMGAMEAWVLQTGAALMRPVNYEWGSSHPPTPGGPKRSNTLAGRVSSLTFEQREALTRAARTNAVRSGPGSAAHDIDLDALVEAARFSKPGGGDREEVAGMVALGLEVHPGTSKEDPVLLSAEFVDHERRRKVPASQDPEVLKYLKSQQT